MTEERKQRAFKPYLVLGGIFFYLGHFITKLFLMAPDTISMSDPLGIGRFQWMIQHPFANGIIDLQPTLISLGVGGLGFLVAIFLYLRVEDTGTYRSREEHGTARLATTTELMGLRDELPENNMILSQHAQMGLYNKRLPYSKQVNKNVGIVGSSGRGKTRNVFKPNILQSNISFMMTDPKGLTIHETGNHLLRKGYKLKIFDLITFLNSDRFNVFHYMDSELDIDRVTTSIIEGTNVSTNTGENFWMQAETLLIRALIGYLYFDGLILKKYMPNIPMVADMLRSLKREDPDVSSPVEEMFAALERDLPGNYACKQFDLFMANFGGQTFMSVLAVTSARFAVFDHDAIRNIVSDDTMEIEKWQLEKTAVFISIPETDKSYNFLANLFFTTVLKVAPKVADEIIKGEREGLGYDDLIHLKLRFDEFAQLGVVPNFTESQASVRSREISIDFVVQARSQVEGLYGKHKADTIFNNCGSLIYLGTNDGDTMKYLSMRSGDQTINTKNQSVTYSQQGSSSESTQSLGRTLFKPDEIARIPLDETLIFIDTFNVYRDKKFVLESHPFYDELSEHPNDGKWYKYKRYMSDIDEWEENVAKEYQIEETPAGIDEFISQYPAA